MPEERKLVTILFADIVGSTPLAQEHDAEVIKASLDRAFAAIEPILVGHGASVEKFIGDAVMAVFGVPAAHDDDADRAVRAAFAIREAVRSLVSPLPLRLRVGVNTGEVVTGVGASGQRLVTGSATNLAQRLQAAAEPGEILVGESTERMTRGGVEYEGARLIEAKGIGQARAFAVRALRGELPEQHRGLEGWHAPLIGRDDELRILLETHRRLASEERAHLATVFGPAGAGKSRLASEFVDLVGESSVRRGRCLPYGEGITFFAAQQIVREDARVGLEMTRDEAIARIRAAAREALAGAPEDADAVADRLLVLGGYGSAEELLVGVPAEEVPDELRWGFRRYLEGRARAQPLVLLFEDIHWAEPGLLDLIDHVAEWARARLFVLCLARPDLLEKRPSWGAGKTNATAIALDPLTPDEMRRLIAKLLGIDAISEELRAEVIARAEGNPLYVEEFLRTLMETGRIDRRDGRWVAAASPAPLELPPTLQGLIAARLDRAPAEVKLLLQRASIAGRTFSVENAKVLLGGEQVPTEHLREAMRRDLIAEANEARVGGGRVYRFKHALVREVAYGAVPKAERARLHDVYGRWLEAQLGDRLDSAIDSVAYHSEQAWAFATEVRSEGAPLLARRAFDHLMRAATLARLRGDLATAAALYERAAAASKVSETTPLERANALGYAVNTRFAVHSDETSVLVIEQAIAVAERADARAVLSVLLMDRGFLADGLHDPDAPRWLDRAVEAARESGDDELLAEALTSRAEPALFSGDFSRAEPLYRDAIAFVRRRGIRVEMPFSSLALALQQRGAFTEGAALIEEARPIVESSGSKLMRLRWLFAQYWGLRGSRRYAEALVLSGERVALAREIGAPSIVGTSLMQHAWLLVALGRTAEARRFVEEASPLMTGTFGRSWAQWLIARVDLAEGELARAETEADRAIAIATDAPFDVNNRALSRSTRAAIHAARGQDREAEERWRQAIAVLATMGWQLFRALSEEELATFLIERGRPHEAVPLLQALLPLYADPLAERPRKDIEALLARASAAHVG